MVKSIKSNQITFICFASSCDLLLVLNQDQEQDRWNQDLNISGFVNITREDYAYYWEVEKVKPAGHWNSLSAWFSMYIIVVRLYVF